MEPQTASNSNMLKELLSENNISTITQAYPIIIKKLPERVAFFIYQY